MVDAELMEIGTGIDIVQIIEGDAHRMVGEHRLLANQLWASRLLCDGALVSGRTRISSRFDPVDREMEKRPEAGGERAAAALVTTLGAKFEIARELVYRLYTVCERKKGAAEALAYNRLARSCPRSPASPARLDRRNPPRRTSWHKEEKKVCRIAC